jgi:hypothetical protein
MSLIRIVNKIEKKLRFQPFLSLDEVKNNINHELSGFYWIYTNLTIQAFKSAPIPTNKAHIDFSDLVNSNEGLRSVIKANENGFWCIYNGKGKQLKSRIVAEFTNTSGKTGKLALLRCFNEDNLKVKYVSCGSIATITKIALPYQQLEKHLERVWRIHVGWPVLCQR